MQTPTTLIALLSVAAAAASASSTGQTTRYWDCCKPSCSWSGKADVTNPVGTCDASNNPLTDPDVTSGCDGGSAYTCSNMSPWSVDENTSYGFAATSLTGGSESTWCCACYSLTFTSGAAKGKKMIVQSTNTGSDLGNNHFDLLIPGGGMGIFDGCTPQYGSPLPGQQYGGVGSRAECDQMPEENLKQGCYWRFDWFGNSDNPSVEWEEVSCPAEITSISGCVRN